MEMHGLSGTPEHISWTSMKSRCDDKKNIAYKYYGERGISYCKEWETFSTFLQDMGPKPGPEYTLDRIRTNEDYSPNNCRWATMSTQINNRRCVKRYTYEGQTLTIKEWAELLNIPHMRIYHKIRRGKTFEEAIK